MEVLIRVVDKGVAEDCSKAGDVIFIAPDNWNWSYEELTNQNWRIIKVPILNTTAEALLAKSINPTIKRRREYYVDFSLLPDPELFNGTRTTDIVTLTKAQVSAAVVKK